MKLNITNGKWTFGKTNNFEYWDIDCNGNRICSIFGGIDTPEEEQEEAEANALLISDAGTTANKCGLLPNELLAQRDELLEALRKLLKSHRQLSAEYEKKIMDTPIEDECYLLIKKVREEQP